MEQNCSLFFLWARRSIPTRQLQKKLERTGARGVPAAGRTAAKFVVSAEKGILDADLHD
jgi:hypothetical protein